ncbi:MAG TPA: copper-binding protein [Paenalcaligenes sp.]|nr:copper-binding protein [Paenalcaligenes sp.]
MHTPAMAQEGSGTGEVRRLDHDNQKITLKHGAISELDLPAITLVYLIEPSMMEGLAPGDSVRFTARRSDDGEYVIIRIRKR